MIVKRLKIENILSIEKAEIGFDSTGLSLIEGWNYDNERSNGAGKTAIFNALSFALYGKMPRGITASEILRKGTKSGSVEVEVDIKGDTYTVHRARPNQLIFAKNGNPIKIQQEEFDRLLGFSYEQFLLCAYSSQNSQTRFISLNDTEKKSFILKLMNMDKFAQCKRIADEKADSISREIGVKLSQINEFNARVAAYKDSLKDEASTVGEITELRNGLKTDISTVDSLSKIEAPDFSNYAEKNNRLSERLASFNAMKSDAAVLRSKISILSSEEESILHKIDGEHDSQECPRCGDSVIVVDGLVKLPNDTAAYSDRIDTVRSDKKKFVDALRIVEGELLAEQDVKAQIDIINKEKADRSFDYRQAQNDIAAIKQTMKHRMSMIQLLESELARQHELKVKISELTSAVRGISLEVDVLQKELVQYQAVSSIFSTTGAQAYVLDSVVDTLNKLVTDNIAAIWHNASYSISTAKENKDGAVVAKLADQLTIDGDQRSIGSLSGGERRALSIAVDLAVIDLLDKQFSMVANPIVFDEPFDGLDSAGREIVIELLAKLATNHQVIVIDHMSESNASFSKTIRVEKRNGISSIT